MSNGGHAQGHLHLLVRPFRKFMQNNTIITQQRQRVLLSLPVPPISRHPLFEYADAGIIGINIEFICEFFQNNNAFADTIGLRFLCFDGRHSRY